MTGAEALFIAWAAAARGLPVPPRLQAIADSYAEQLPRSYLAGLQSSISLYRSPKLAVTLRSTSSRNSGWLA
jgi:hypothetical protein